MRKSILLLFVVIAPCTLACQYMNQDPTDPRSIDAIHGNIETMVDDAESFDLLVHSAKADLSKTWSSRAIRRLLRTNGVVTTKKLRWLMIFLARYRNIRKVSKKTIRILSAVVKALERLARTKNFQRDTSRSSRKVRTSPQFRRLVSLLTGCMAGRSPTRCTARDRKYRRPDGVCNNKQSPLLGAANTLIARFLKPDYGNNFNSPRKSIGRRQLPSPRAVSRILTLGVEKDSRKVTDMLKTFGQFLDHDMVLTPHVSGSSCKDCKRNRQCLPIRVPKNDNRVTKKCLPFGRSFPACGTGISSIFYPALTRKEQLNTITSFVDGSNIYGSSDELLNKLRDKNKKSGRLAVFKSGSGEEFLPFDTTFPPQCTSATCFPNFLAGDVRANENIQLVAMHTIWVRFHNYVAGELKRQNPKWNGEKLFQEARKITIAVLQNVVFNEYLPVILGRRLSKYRGYNRRINPSIFNGFSTAVFRFGHTQIKETILRLNKNLKAIKYGNIQLHKTFFRPNLVIKEGGVDPLLRGLFAEEGRGKGPKVKAIAEEIRERLFALDENPAEDLAALNIQRGRDHGIRGYFDYASRCKSNMQLVSRKAQLRLKRLYRHRRNVDLWVGGVLEKNAPGAQVGPTFRCLLEEQFQKLRNGDRFYFEARGQFKANQIREIKKMKLANVICLVARNIKKVPSKIFKATSPGNYRNCRRLKMNLGLWKEN